MNDDETRAETLLPDGRDARTGQFRSGHAYEFELGNPGAQSTYQADVAGVIVERVREGATLEVVSSELGLQRRMIQNWAVANPPFAAALEQAREQFRAQHGGMLPPPSARRAYNAEVHKRIVEARRLGCTNRAIAGIIGVHRRSVDAWLEPTSDLYIEELARDCEAALGEAQMFRLAIVERAAQKSWQAAAWMLERLNPEAYALQNRLMVNQTTNNVTTTVNANLPSEEELQLAARRIADWRQRINEAIDVTPAGRAPADTPEDLP